MKHYLVDEPDNPVIYTVGKVHVDMDEFLGDITCPIPVEIERFRRNTFQLTNKENECKLQAKLSTSIIFIQTRRWMGWHEYIVTPASSCVSNETFNNSW